MRRLIIAAMAAAPVLALAMAVPADAAGHHAAVPAVGTGPWHIKEQNGSYYVSAPSIAAGNPVIEGTSGAARNMHWANDAPLYSGGDAAGHLTFSNGNFLATTANCNATVKSSGSSDGTLWAIHLASGNLYIVNEFCDRLAGGPDNIALSGSNSSGTQFNAQGPGLGQFRAMTFIAA